MQQHKKFRSPEQGYSRATMKARTSRAIHATLESEEEIDAEVLAPDSITSLMLGPHMEEMVAEVTPVAQAPTAPRTTASVTPQGAMADDSSIDSGRLVAVRGAVTHVVRGEASQPRGTTAKQGMIDRLLSMIRRSR